MKGKEGVVEDALIAAAEAAGGVCIKFSANSGTAGVPDRVLVVAGHTVFVELKDAHKKLMTRQTVRCTELIRAGARVEVIDNPADARALVDQLCQDSHGTTEQRCRAAETFYLSHPHPARLQTMKRGVA